MTISLPHSNSRREILGFKINSHFVRWNYWKPKKSARNLLITMVLNQFREGKLWEFAHENLGHVLVNPTLASARSASLLSGKSIEEVICTAQYYFFYDYVDNFIKNCALTLLIYWLDICSWSFLYMGLRPMKYSINGEPKIPTNMSPIIIQLLR